MISKKSGCLIYIISFLIVLMKTNENNQPRSEVAEIMDSIRHIFKALRVASIQFEKAVGLSAAQMFVLKKVHEEPWLSINDLALRTTTHQSSVSVVVKKLEERGLVCRAASPEDSRRSIIALTPTGEQILGKAPKMVQESMIEALQSMSPKKTQELSLLLNEFISNAGLAEGGPAPMFEER